MKTSNIILITLFGLGLIFIVALQLYIKSIESDKRSKECELNPGLFTTLKIDSGWDIIVEKGDTSKVTFADDSIKDFFSVNGNTLVIKELKMDSVKHYPITITTKKIDQIAMIGNSQLRYHTENIDSLIVDISGKSKVTIQKSNISNNQSIREKNAGTINYVSAKLSDKSTLTIYQNINFFIAELNDSSYCRLSGIVKIEKLSKAKTAGLGMW